MKKSTQLIELLKRVKEFNQKYPVGCLINFSDQENTTHTRQLIGSAREKDMDVFVQVKGVEGLVPIKKIMSVA